ncbi:MAG: CoA transferase [Terriglobales bacterium]
MAETAAPELFRWLAAGKETEILADGKIALAALEPAIWSRFCLAASHPEWSGAAFSPTAAHNPLYRELCSMFCRRTAAEWDAWAEQNAVALRALRPHPAPAPMPPWTSR